MIEVKDLIKKYGNKTVLSSIDINLSQGDFVGLVGPNGVGKTTLLSSLVNLVRPDKGDIIIAGRHHEHRDYIKNIGFMQDNSVLYPHLTGYDHLSYVAYAHGLKDSDIVNTSKKVGNISYLNQKVKEYSLGMKQHLLFACAIIHKPSVLLLDEPFNGLDPTSLIRIREQIRELNHLGTTVLVSSHNLNEIDRMTNHILFLKNGDLLKYNLIEYRQKSYVITLQENLLEKFSEETFTILAPNKLLVENSCFKSMLAKLINKGYTIEDIESRVTGSEDLYKEIYQI